MTELAGVRGRVHRRRGANLFGFVGSVCGPLVFATVASWTGSFSWSFLLIAGQLVAFGLFAI